MIFNFSFCPNLKIFRKKKADTTLRNLSELRDVVNERDLIKLENIKYIKLPDDFSFDKTLNVYIHDLQDRYICLYNSKENHLFKDKPDVRNKHISDILPDKFAKEIKVLLNEAKVTGTNRQYIYFSGEYRILDVVPIIINNEVKGTVLLERTRVSLSET